MNALDVVGDAGRRTNAGFWSVDKNVFGSTELPAF